jgi:hypothetical protein
MEIVTEIHIDLYTKDGINKFLNLRILLNFNLRKKNCHTHGLTYFRLCRHI